MALEPELPPQLQLLYWLIAPIAAVCMWFIGGRKKHHRDDNSDELNTLRQAVERGQTDRDIDKLRREFAQVIEATRVGLEERMENIKREIIHIIDDKLRRGRGAGRNE